MAQSIIIHCLQLFLQQARFWVGRDCDDKDDGDTPIVDEDWGKLEDGACFDDYVEGTKMYTTETVIIMDIGEFIAERNNYPLCNVP